MHIQADPHSWHALHGKSTLIRMSSLVSRARRFVWGRKINRLVIVAHLP